MLKTQKIFENETYDNFTEEINNIPLNSYDDERIFIHYLI